MEIVLIHFPEAFLNIGLELAGTCCTRADSDDCFDLVDVDRGQVQR